MNWKVPNLCPFPVSHAVKLLTYQAELCSTITLYIDIKSNLRSNSTPVCWYLFTDLNRTWFGLKSCESHYLRKMFTLFSSYSARKECVCECSFCSSDSLYIMQQIFFSTLPSVITSETSVLFLSINKIILRNIILIPFLNLTLNDTDLHIRACVLCQDPRFGRV